MVPLLGDFPHDFDAVEFVPVAAERNAVGPG